MRNFKGEKMENLLLMLFCGFRFMNNRAQKKNGERNPSEKISN